MIELPNTWGALGWLIPAIGMAGLLLIALAITYLFADAPVWVRVVSGLAKAAAIVLLALILLEPKRNDVRPRPGENLFVILADGSQSLEVRDEGVGETRAEQLKRRLERTAAWQVRLGQDFDVRRYVFDRRVRPVTDYSDYTADGGGTSLVASLRTVAQRYEGRPSAGILLLTDGNATDAIGADANVDWTDLPPVYPVVIGADDSPRDIAIARISVSQTNFEAAPVTISAEVSAHGYAGQTIVTELLDEEGKVCETRRVAEVQDDKPFALRFQVRPEKQGVMFYRVRAYAENEAEAFDKPEESPEATLENNVRLAAVDRGGGPYRVLYVTGRPNWEYKFLRRAEDEDEEVNLVGLVRVAKREPRFKFRARDDGGANPLFGGFSEKGEEEVEKYDEPVLIRFGTVDEEELRAGFPIAAEELFQYDAIVLDDVEAEFFNRDQQSLIQEFVSQRGGGLLMLGGQESFAKGDYAHTPIGEMLPVYVDRAGTPAPDGGYKLLLTREGWLQPWVRVRSTEPEEARRLETMPAFKTVNQIAAIKPGASVLARVKTDDDATFPALVVQRFGKGRAAAVTVGDLWRWHLRREKPEDDDQAKAWRQTIRWLVGDVPRRVEVDVRRAGEDPNQPLELRVSVFDESYKPLDNAGVVVKIATPDDKHLELTAEPADAAPGVYTVSYAPRIAGAYRAEVAAAALDGSEIGRRETGWASEPASEEFRTLKPNRSLLERIAKETGGEVIGLGDLDSFVAGLPSRKIPITEPHVFEVWHHWLVFTLAIGLLVGEWGLRRMKGLP